MIKMMIMITIMNDKSKTFLMLSNSDVPFSFLFFYFVESTKLNTFSFNNKFIMSSLHHHLLSHKIMCAYTTAVVKFNENLLNFLLKVLFLYV